MKKTALLLLPLLAIGLSACEDREQYTSDPQYVNLSIGQTYTHDAGDHPEGGELEVTIDPQHASFFEMSHSDSLNTHIVTYTPEAGYEGTDYFQVVRSESLAEDAKKTVIHYYVTVTP
jgi:hypothetical protein